MSEDNELKVGKLYRTLTSAVWWLYEPGMRDRNIEEIVGKGFPIPKGSILLYLGRVVDRDFSTFLWEEKRVVSSIALFENPFKFIEEAKNE